MDRVFGQSVPDKKSNALVDIAIAAIHAVLRGLDRVKALITWITITLPRYVRSPRALTILLQRADADDTV